MKAGRIARNEDGVVGIVISRRMGVKKEKYNDYEKRNGKYILVGVKIREVPERLAYTGVDLSGAPWEGKQITPLRQDELLALG